MKQLFIIRGAPGSGKTTFAMKIAQFVCEADDYFIDGYDGIYKWDKEKLKAAHTYCQHLVRRFMELGESPIAVSNTGIKRWESKVYREMAKEFGYEVTEIKMLGDFISNHGVPIETIERMKREWED